MNVMGIIFTNDATMGELTNKRTHGSVIGKNNTHYVHCDILLIKP